MKTIPKGRREKEEDFANRKKGVAGRGGKRAGKGKTGELRTRYYLTVTILSNRMEIANRGGGCNKGRRGQGESTEKRENKHLRLKREAEFHKVIESDQPVGVETDMSKKEKVGWTTSDRKKTCDE